MNNEMRTGVEGFSLLELVMVVVIIGMLVLVGLPTFLSMVPNMQLSDTSRKVYGALARAKGEAAKRNNTCTVIFNQTIGGVNYPFVVIEDNNPGVNRMSDYDAGEPVIMISSNTLPEHVSFDVAKGGGDGVSFPNNDDGKPSISFRSTTIPTDNNGGLANGTIFLKNSRGKESSVVVGQSGNIRIE